MRRKPGVLLPIECSILATAVELRLQGIDEFHGFQIAKEIKERNGARFLTGYGTLYRALGRLQQRGLLDSRWEDQLHADQNRPRRRYYRLTLTGVEASVPLNSIPGNAPNRVLSWGVSQS